MAANREQFGSRLGFILAAAGSAVGIGNVVGFPVAAAKNGGISKIATVDVTSKGGLLKSTVTTTVTGN